MKIGCGFDPKIYIVNSDYRDLIRRHFTFVIPTWGMAPTSHHKQPNFKALSVVEEGVNAAVEDGLEVHGHFLMSRFSIPDWLKELADRGFSDSLQLLQQTISEVVGFWGDRISDWIVANEMITANGLAPAHPWTRLVGDSMLSHAFNAAHAANPKAKLWLKDFGIQHPWQWDAVYKEVARLKAQQIPIYGVGAHLHLNLFPVRTNRYVIDNIAAHLYPYHGIRINLFKHQVRRFQKLGLAFQASEVLVFPGGNHDLNQKAMAHAYQRYFQTSKDVGCSHFSVWCPVDDCRYPKLTWHWQGKQDYPGIWRWEEGLGYQTKFELL
ncbi:MAG: endo-1,4-beta-xylanase [Leptolyngbyaceae cyanobacterium MO_188.B28]|nr:endo-1,4-beta-xylanase [Leptolyngbyaceae cyanobacterium MO_188.B28]